MTAIIISSKILDGNLGDGWPDNYVAAQALARFTRDMWRDETTLFRAAGHTVRIEVEVRRNAHGDSPAREVSTQPFDYGLQQDVETAITPENRLWELFADSPQADGNLLTRRAIVLWIGDYSRKCRAAEYTDTDEAWNLLNRIRDALT
jgi:hypothetical protein